MRDALSQPTPPPDRTLAYGPGPDQVLDLRLPFVASTLPLVVFLHGGFWRAAWDRAHTGPLAADLALRGFPVACLEYRRTGQPGGGWPGTFDDVLAGVRAAPELVGSPGPPILAGHSAGGHLALWAASRVPVRGVLALAPVADLVEGYRLGLGGGAVADLLGGPPERVPQRYAAADPAPAAVPTIVLHGQCDAHVPVQLSRAYAARAGAAVRLVELPDTEHFGLINHRSGAWPTVIDALMTLGAQW